jgi:hypothetical protein
MLTGLHSVQGYNPTHIARYDQFMSALNGDGQNYHFIDVYEKGLASPLLNLLNVRYIIVPSHNSQEVNRRGLQHSLQQFERFERTHPTVYEDDHSKVLENQEALPRAWIVHSARKENPKEALRLLDSGEVNPRKEALLDEEPPQQMSKSPNDDDASDDQALVEEYEANNMKLKTSSSSGGLLVLSEVYYPSWKAYVDGEPAEVYATDQLLRSVPIPAGEHEVELRYESEALEVGIMISVVAYAVLIVMVFGAGVQYRRKSVGNAKST